MTAFLAALALAAAPAAAGPGSPEVEKVLAELREDYLQDRQPSWFLAPPQGLSAEDAAALRRLTEAVNSVQAGYARGAGRSLDRFIAAQKLAKAALKLEGREAGAAPADELYDKRQLPAPAHFHLNLERAREARRAARSGTPYFMSWEQLRARMFGPLIEPLVEDPDARLVLPPGHPYRGELDPNEPPPDPEGRDLARWVEEESRRRGADLLPFSERLRVLAEIHAQAAERAAERERLHCAAPNSYACDLARMRAARHGSRAALYPELAGCAEKPQECGGELCGVLFFCEAGRSIVAAALTPALALQIAGEVAAGKLRLLRRGADGVRGAFRRKDRAAPPAPRSADEVAVIKKEAERRVQRYAAGWACLDVAALFGAAGGKLVACSQEMLRAVASNGWDYKLALCASGRPGLAAVFDRHEPYFRVMDEKGGLYGADLRSRGPEDKTKPFKEMSDAEKKAHDVRQRETHFLDKRHLANRVEALEERKRREGGKDFDHQRLARYRGLLRRCP